MTESLEACSNIPLCEATVTRVFCGLWLLLISLFNHCLDFQQHPCFQQQLVSVENARLLFLFAYFPLYARSLTPSLHLHPPWWLISLWSILSRFKWFGDISVPWNVPSIWKQYKSAQRAMWTFVIDFLEEYETVLSSHHISESMSLSSLGICITGMLDKLLQIC